MTPSPKGHYFEREGGEPPLPCLLCAVLSVRGAAGNPNHAHLHPNDWVLDYSIYDCGFCKAGEEAEPWLPRTPRIAHLYPPGTRYWEDPKGGSDPCVSSWIIFKGGERASLGKFALGRPAFGRFHDIDGKIGDILNEMASAGALRGDSSFWEEQSLLFRLFDMLHSATPLPGGAPYEWMFPGEEKDGDAKFLKQAQELLSKRLGEKTGLEELARELGMSVSSFSHRYSKLAGEGPMKTLAKLRVSAAKGLVLKGQRMRDVAAATGFCDEFHLSKAFKSQTGLSPKGYLKSARETVRPDAQQDE